MDTEKRASGESMCIKDRRGGGFKKKNTPIMEAEINGRAFGLRHFDEYTFGAESLP